MITGAVVAFGFLMMDGKQASKARAAGKVVVFPKTLDVGQLVIYVLLTSVLLAWPALQPILAEWIPGLVCLGYILIILPGLSFGRPFSLEYCDTIPSWIQKKSDFISRVVFYSWLWLWLILVMAGFSLAPPIYHLIYMKPMHWLCKLVLEFAQYPLLIYGLMKPRRDDTKVVVSWGFGLADQLPEDRIRHPPKRLSDSNGKLLPGIVGSGRLHPRPHPVYKKPESSQSDIMPNMQVKSAPSLQKFGLPRGPWNMRYKAYFELDDRPRKCAVLIDDVQEGYRKFFDEGYLRAQLAVLDAARAGGIPVFWSYWGRTDPHDGGYWTYDEFYGPYGTGEFKGMNATYLVTPKSAEILPELGPRTPSEHQRVIKSIHMDCFGNKDETGQSIFKASLDALGVDTLVLTGCWTDACVIATCIRAVTEDFNVILPEDAVFSCTAAADSALEVMRNLYAKVVPAEEVAMYLRSAVSD